MAYTPLRSGALTARLPRLIEIYARDRGLAVSTVGRHVGGHGSFCARASEGRITLRRARRALQWLSDHWPADLPWPDDIPRPAPSPAAAPSIPTARPDRRKAVLAARERMHDAVTAGDWEAAQAHERAMLEAALACRADGQIADPESLCLALRLPRYVYDDVVRRYADGRNRRPPRRGSSVERMVNALRAAGDVRFRRRGAGSEAAAVLPREGAA